VLAVVRPSLTDAEAIAELCNAHSEELYGEAAVDRDEVKRWFTLPNLHLWVAKDANGGLAAYGDVHEEDENRRYWLDLREHPARRAQGGGAALLEAVEGWARSRAAPGALLRGAAASADEQLLDLYKDSGYRLVRHMLEMRISFAEDPAAPRWPDGIRVREFMPGQDERAVYDVDMEAFEDHWEFVRWRFDEWRVWAIEHPRFDPSLWFLAVDGAEPVGCCLGGVHASGDPSFGYVATLAVRRPWRQRGLGLALLQHAFREFHRRGMKQAALHVDAENLTGAVRLYERAGMHVHRQRDTYEKAL
jgi:mycothiol synthase